MLSLKTAWVIAAAEITAAFRQRSVHVMAAVLSVMLVSSAVLGALRARKVDEDRRHYQSLVRQQWEAQPDRHPHRVAHFGSFAFRLPGPLASFDFGLDAFVGTTIYQEAHRQNTASFSEAGNASTMLRFGQLSPAMVLQIFVPLVVWFWGFGTIATERERGTLRLLRSLGLTLRTLVVGKVAGMLFLLLGAITPALVIALICLGALGGPVAGEATTARIFLMAAAYGLYLLTWVVAVAAISAHARTARGALAFGLSVWVVVVILLPRTAAGLAAVLHPSPSQNEFFAAVARDLRREGDSHNPNDPKFAALKQKTLDEAGVKRVEDLPVNFNGVVMEFAEKLGAEVQQRHRQRLLEIYGKQEEVIAWASGLSPFVALRSISMTLAGTGLSDVVAFEAEAERNRYALVQKLNQLHKQEIRHQADRAQHVSSAHWRQMRTFEAQPLPLRETVSRLVQPALVLLAWLAGLSMFALRRPGPGQWGDA